MIVYIINREYLSSLILPVNISGSYYINDVSNNKEDKLINISEKDGKWVAYSNKHVKILNGRNKLESIELKEHMTLYLQVDNSDNYLILYTCPVNDLSDVETKVNNDCEFLIGSGSDCQIRYENQLVSPRHAKVIYQNNIWYLEDLDSKSGVYVNNKKIGAGTNKILHGDVVFIMGFKLIFFGNHIVFNNPLNKVTYNERMLVNVHNKVKNGFINRDNDDEIKLYEDTEYFTRYPRFTEVIENVDFKMEAAPKMGEPDQTPMLYTIGPMLTMASTSVVMLVSAIISYQNNPNNISSLIMMGGMSISMLAGSLLWPSLNKRFQKKQDKKKREKINTKYNEYLNEKEKDLETIMVTQKQSMLSNSKSTAECFDIVTKRSRNLWERELKQDDFLMLRLGLGNVPLRINLNAPEKHFEVDENDLNTKMFQLIDKYKTIEGAPITQSFIEKNITALIGQYEFIKSFADSLILQMISLHSYFDLKVVIITSNSRKDKWSYLKQVPHIFSNDREIRFFATTNDEKKEVMQYLQNILNERIDAVNEKGNSKSYKNFSSYYMIISDDYDSISDDPFCENYFKQDINLGFSFLILKNSFSNLPTKCKSFIGINSYNNGEIFESELKKENHKSFAIEATNNINYKLCTLYLANTPIESVDGGEFALPKNVNFLEMYDAGNIEQLNVLEKWKVNNPIISLSVPIGVAQNGSYFRLDLHEKEQGPHGLIAGMTGSGKSEFIITYILSMAVNFHPDEVQFVLIDYKGGGLVGAFENNDTGIKLPHLAGTITNLDKVEINRALASIESELKRRQKLFNEARNKLGEGTIDIYKYQRYYREGLIDEPISHLFIISDEFAELKSQQPEFMDQLISTARIGRSLGVHLILATQKPSGVVNDQIWSNSRFKVCLKVQDAGDSNEVIKKPDAAFLKDVGRFYLQVGFNEFFAIGQAAYAGSSYIPKDKVVHVVDDKINYINNVGRSIKTYEIPKNENTVVKGELLPNIVSYLNDLADKQKIKVKQLWLEKLPNFISLTSVVKKFSFVRKPYELNPIIGVYDSPDTQSQGLVTVDFLNKGNAVIYSMNEKTTIVNTLLYSLITTYPTNELNIYALDFDSQTLKVFSDAPQVGDVIFSNEKEKVKKLFMMLNSQLETRKQILQNYNGSYDFYCKNSSTKMPAIVFVISGYENFKETYEELENDVVKISRDGVKCGIYTVITAISERSLRLNLRNCFSQAIPLKLSAPIDYNMLLGKKAPIIAEGDNRGVYAINDELYEFQVASVCEKENFNYVIKETCKQLIEQLTEKAPHIKVLPEHVNWNDISHDGISYNAIPVGLFEDSLEIAKFNPTKSLFSLFNASSDEFLKALVSGVFKHTNDSDFDAMVYDPRSNFNIGNSSFEDIMNAIYDSSRSKQLIVFIASFTSFINEIPSEFKTNIDGYFAPIDALNNCHFIIASKTDDVKTYAFQPWFKKYVSLDSFIFVGRGISSVTMYSLSTPLRELSVPIPPNYGFFVSNGTAISIKVLEEDLNNE